MRALYVVFWAAMTLALWVVSSLVLLAIFWPVLVKADTLFPDQKQRCAISRATYGRAMEASNHPLLIRFPADLSRRFIISWNEGVPGFGVPLATDNVTLFDYPRVPFYKVAFFKSDCLVESVDVPVGTFWEVVGHAGGGKWRI